MRDVRVPLSEVFIATNSARIWGKPTRHTTHQGVARRSCYKWPPQNQQRHAHPVCALGARFTRICLVWQRRRSSILLVRYVNPYGLCVYARWCKH